jgi:regulator of protease activity HflC (stomatin/prohibitin superfamily)
MDSLEPLQVAITYNKITKQTGTEIYHSGRYLIGPFMSFLVYPSNQITIEFSEDRQAQSQPLQTRTGEGLGLVLHLSFQYKVNSTEIPKLYALANVNYHATYVRISRDIILKVAGMYNATNYWTDRQSIGEHRKDALNEELKNAYASVSFLQLLKIELPQSYEDSIVNTQVEVQKTNMKKFEQQATLIRQSIDVMVSEAEQKIKVVNATGSAEAFKIKQFATAAANNNTINAESAIYNTIKTGTDFTDPELTQYVFMDSVKQNENAKLLFGLQNTIINFGNQPSEMH